MNLGDGGSCGLCNFCYTIFYSFKIRKKLRFSIYILCFCSIFHKNFTLIGDIINFKFYTCKIIRNITKVRCMVRQGL